MKTFFISDLHFGHKNIIAYENRPFASIDEMDTELIKRWNNTVGKEDIVWFLGDLAMSSNRIKLKGLVSQLQGRKYMIMGNHDNLKVKDYYEMGFEFVSKYPVILKHHFILSHAPMADMCDESPFFYIYGHIHGSSNYLTSTINSRCVCVERQDYRPITLSEFDNYKYDFKEYSPQKAN